MGLSRAVEYRDKVQSSVPRLASEKCKRQCDGEDGFLVSTPLNASDGHHAVAQSERCENDEALTSFYIQNGNDGEYEALRSTMHAKSTEPASTTG